MSDEIYLSKQFDPNRWEVEPSIKGPFNLEMIIRSCPVLHAHWKKNPFNFDLDENNRIIVRYLHIP